MITLSNGHKFEFCCASGALGYDGEGWWYERPFRWLGLIDPYAFTIITKTLTYLPRKGQYKTWKPWQSVRAGLGYVVNAVGLTNPGYQYWINNDYKHVKEKQYKVIVSLMPDTVQEAHDMAKDMDDVDVAGIELNVSCPNVKHESKLERICEIVEEFYKNTDHPLILKLGMDQPYLDICMELSNRVQAFDLINSVPWKMVYPYDLSPFKHLGNGGVSGPDIKVFSTVALLKVKKWLPNVQVINGGGITTYREAALRFRLGANAVSFGTVFMKTPWRPNAIVNKFRDQYAIQEPLDL